MIPKSLIALTLKPKLEFFVPRIRVVLNILETLF